MEKKPGLKFDPGWVLVGVRTTGPRYYLRNRFAIHGIEIYPFDSIIHVLKN